MAKQSRIPIYGGKAPPPYVASAGNNVIIPGNSRNWSTNIKSPTRWSQIGRNTSYPQVFGTDNWTSFKAALGNNTLVVTNFRQVITSPSIGYYLKAGGGFLPCSADTVSLSGLNTLTIDFGNGVFVAGGGGISGNTVRIARSVDGINWVGIEVTTGVFPGFDNVTTWTTFDNSNFYMSFGTGSTPPFPDLMYKSADGLTWTSFNSPVANAISDWRIKAINGRIFALLIGSNPNYYVTLNEGASWATHTPTIKMFPDAFTNLTYIAIPTNIPFDPNYYISSDGINWAAINNTLSLARVTVVAGNFRAVDRSGSRIYESTDGINWVFIEEAITGAFPIGLFYGTL